MYVEYQTHYVTDLIYWWHEYLFLKYLQHPMFIISPTVKTLQKCNLTRVVPVLPLTL